MRMFLNAIFDFKPKDKAFVTVPSILREVLEEGGWVPKRFLFDLYDINEAASEGHPHGYWLYLCLAIRSTARYAVPVNMELICYGVNFRMRYNCSLHRDFGMPKDTPADEAAFQVFQEALNRFRKEMVPQLADVFGETPDMFYQHSHVFEYSKEFDV